MIHSFKDRDTAELAQTGRNKRWRVIESLAHRKLDMIEVAVKLENLRLPTGNSLEALTGRRKGQHSIRIDKQYRICFVWKEDGAYEVEVVDYHDEPKRGR